MGALLLPICAEAGAWGRAPGAGFVSGAVTSTASGEVDLSIYGEYGLARDTFAGLNVFLSRPATAQESADITLHLSRHFGSVFNDTQTAAGLIAGAETDSGSARGYAGVALHLGRAIRPAGRGGWAALDTQARWDLRSRELRLKTDLTLGVSITDRTTVMIQLFNDRSENGSSLTLAPAVLLRPSQAPRQWLIGAELPRGAGAARIKIGVWQEF
jgi:hypothetical protein